MDMALLRVHREVDTAAVLADPPVGGEGVNVFWVRVLSFCSMIRQVGGYNDYTWYHLPVWNCSPPCPRKAEAIFAIFAARMALSSLEIRSLAR